MERHQRLKWARERRGFSTAAEAARYLNVPYGTYSSHESGIRGIKDEQLAVYARAFRVSLSWLSFGQGEPSLTAEQPEMMPVPIVGIVGTERTGAVIPKAGLGTVRVWWGGDQRWEALLVEGTRLEPVHREGSLLFYRPIAHDLAALKNHECVVELANGQKLLKFLYPGTKPGRWSLESSFAAPLVNQEVKWASPIRLVQTWRTENDFKATA